jgi:8-oxo-dGTP diphosphatase
MYTYQYPRPSVTVDGAIFCKVKNENYVLLIQRKNDPFKEKWAFPGGFVDMDEDLETAAFRELKEETGFDALELQQFKTYGAVDRDPRGRTISIVYVGLMEENELPYVKGEDDAMKAQWISLSDVPDLAFDHNQIMKDLRNHYNL